MHGARRAATVVWFLDITTFILIGQRDSLLGSHLAVVMASSPFFCFTEHFYNLARRDRLGFKPLINQTAVRRANHLARI